MTLFQRHSNDRERVRDASDIVRVVGEHVALKAKGREYVGLCPFHDDHTPSMSVVPHKQIFHCFVCGAGGGAFDFVMKYHHMDFREALHYLAERAGIELAPARAPSPAGDESDERQGPTRTDLLGANAHAGDFFRTILRHPDHGAPARAVVERRAISPEMAEAFALGAAPDRWDGLALTVQKKGLDLRPFAEAGLVKRRDKGEGFYDALRHRLIFPIHDQIGRIIAFGGRRLNDEDEPKYLNSPETRLFNKSSTLYGLHQASRAIQRERIAVITEGYTDVIACHQAGFPHTVATLGTALTPGHATVLRRLCDTVILLFDGDAAGQRAADRAVEVFFAEQIDVKIATLARYTDAKDPDELLKREGGAEIFRAALAGAADLLEYRYDRIKERLAGAGPAALERATMEDLTRLADLGLARVNPRRRQLVIRRLSEITGLSPDVLAASVPTGRAAPRRDDAPGAGSPRATRVEADPAPGRSPRERLLGCVLCDGALWGSLTGAQRDLLSPRAYPTPLLQSLAQAITDTALDGGSPDLDGVLRRLEDPAATALAVALERRVQTETDENPERLRLEWQGCLARLAADAPRPAPDAAPPAGSDDDGTHAIAQQIDLRRQHHATHGPDRRKLPRPSALGRGGGG